MAFLRDHLFKYLNHVCVCVFVVVYVSAAMDPLERTGSAGADSRSRQ